MKRLILVPVIHAEGSTTDLMDSLIKTESTEDLAPRRKELWSLIHNKVANLTSIIGDLNPQKTKLFMDGQTEEIKPPEDRMLILFPEQEKELRKHIAESTGFGEGEFNLAIQLLAQGIPLMKTEEADHTDRTLKARDELVDIFAQWATSPENWDLELNEEELSRIDECLKKIDESVALRDLDIVRNVKEQLGEGETGILILGKSHRVWDKFGADIQVEFLDPELERLASEGNKSLYEKWRSFLENPQGSPENKG